jgi:ubiquitin-like 1-activating enzyme E1 B
MADLWKTRAKPVKLDIKNLKPKKPTSVELDFDQKVWEVTECIHVFLDAMNQLGSRASKGEELEFDKDDEQALNFVTAASNIRAHLFHIERKSRFAVKEMAGNIIPAIATTNAIVAGMIVMCAVKVLSGQVNKAKNTFVAYGGDGQHFLMNESLPKPNPQCSVCTNTYLQVSVPLDTRLQDFVEQVVNELNIGGEVTLQSGNTLIYDVEFEENFELTLQELGMKDNDELLLTNDDDDETKCYSIVLFVKEYNGLT